MAAYGGRWPAYMGTLDAYPRGDYEVEAASKVAPEAEDAIGPALRQLLDVPADGTTTTPSEILGEEKPRISL